MKRRVMPAAAVFLAATIAFAGCTPPAAERTAWQRTVETVAAQASGGDYATALATLDALETDVVSRRDAGEVSAEQTDAILGRIATVRADLIALVPSPTPTPTPTLEPEPAPTSEPTPEPQPTASDGASDDDGSDDDGSDGDDRSVAPSPADPGTPDEQAPGGDQKDKGPGKDGTGPGSGQGPGKKDG